MRTPAGVDLEPGGVMYFGQRRVPSITLTTCYPFDMIDAVPQRLIVHAALKQQVESWQFDYGSA